MRKKKRTPVAGGTWLARDLHLRPKQKRLGALTQKARRRGNAGRKRAAPPGVANAPGPTERDVKELREELRLVQLEKSRRKKKKKKK